MSRSALAASVRHLRGQLAVQGRNDESDEQLLHAFTTRRDENAFAVLVRRYGPMVLHVCRRVLGHQQDAEDAFQATFLVLARSAADLRKKTTLASFLHGTAYRIALSAKRSAARRRKHEGETPSRPPANPSDDLLWHEVRMLLDEEIARLPEVYRSVFVLCCLENLSQAEAGRRLGLKERTVSSRLAEARKRLQQRLTRRGVELSALLAATALATETASALPIALLTKTTGAEVSPTVAALVNGGSSLLSAGKIKLATALVLMTSVLTGAAVCGFALSHKQSIAPPQPAAEERAEKPKSRTPGEQQRKSVAVSGRVLDPDGKPVEGAKLVFLYSSVKKILKKIWATSSADGRFDFTIPRMLVEDPSSQSPWEGTHVVAAAEGYGFAVTPLGKPGAVNLTLRLSKDDVPIRGRIINLEGKPVAGARVRIANRLGMSKKGDLAAWLAARKANKENPNNVDWAYLTWLYSPAFDLLLPPVLTGADGRFEMKGIGRERVAYLRIEGPTIATQEIPAMTRPSETIRRLENKEHPQERIVTCHGVAFELLAAPTRPVVGVVRDKDTGKPLGGVTVETNGSANIQRTGFIHTITDKDGRYRLVGLPKGTGNEIAATTDDLPYLSAVEKVGNPLGLKPITVDFALKRGVWVTGRVTEKTTGKPLGANVNYFCLHDNPNAKEIVRLKRPYNFRPTEKDGSFRIAAVAGRGLIAVRAYRNHYVMAVGAEKIKRSSDERERHVFDTIPLDCCPEDFHTLVEITPKLGDESIVCDVTLDPGRTLRGTVLGPDDKPLAGARVSDLKDIGYWENDPLPGADFVVLSLKPNKPRGLQFLHEGKKLAGFLVLRGDEKGPLRVRLEPWGTLTGRLVTLQGEPLTGERVRVDCYVDMKRNGQAVNTAARVVRPDKEGRFRIEGLMPGLKYELCVMTGSYPLKIEGGGPKDLTTKAGETKDLGELRVKPRE